MSKAKDIVDKAKSELIQLVIGQVYKIDGIIHYHSDEAEASYVSSDDTDMYITIDVLVDEPYLDVDDDMYERQRVEYIGVNNGGELIVETEANPILAKYLSVYDLMAISDGLDKVLEKILNNNGLNDKFVHRVANHCYYDFDSLKECESCSRKGKCWDETIKLLKEESV